MVSPAVFSEQIVLPAGGWTLTALDDRQQIVGFATKLAGRIVCRVKHRSALANMDPEDIEQELLTYVLEHVERYDRSRGNTEAFATQLMQTAVAKLIRKSTRKRCNPPVGFKLESLSKAVDGPHRKSEELNKGLASADKDRRRQTVSRDPLQDLELADAIAHQIRALPFNCRRVARLLRSCTQVEIAIRLGWSKRKVSEAMAEIRERFASVEWGEIHFVRDEPSPDCIDSTGEEDISEPTQSTHEENVL